MNPPEDPDTTACALPAEMLAHVFLQLFTGPDEALSAFMPCALACRRWHNVAHYVGRRVSEDTVRFGCYRERGDAYVYGRALRIRNPADWAHATMVMAALEGRAGVMYWAISNLDTRPCAQYAHCVAGGNVETARVLSECVTMRSPDSSVPIPLTLAWDQKVTPEYADWFLHQHPDNNMWSLWVHAMGANDFDCMRHLHAVYDREVFHRFAASWILEAVNNGRYTLESVEFMCRNFEFDRPQWVVMSAAVDYPLRQANLEVARILLNHGLAVCQDTIAGARRALHPDMIRILDAHVTSAASKLQ
jgi:hypothetical protein